MSDEIILLKIAAIEREIADIDQRKAEHLRQLTLLYNNMSVVFCKHVFDCSCRCTRRTLSATRIVTRITRLAKMKSPHQPACDAPVGLML